MELQQSLAAEAAAKIQQQVRVSNHTSFFIKCFLYVNAAFQFDYITVVNFTKDEFNSAALILSRQVEVHSNTLYSLYIYN